MQPGSRPLPPPRIQRAGSRRAAERQDGPSLGFHPVLQAAERSVAALGLGSSALARGLAAWERDCGLVRVVGTQDLLPDAYEGAAVMGGGIEVL